MILGLAPMDGITDLPYRTIVKKIFDTYNTDHELRCWTEFMNTDGYMTHPAKLVKHLIHHEQENTLYAQIYGGNPDTLRRAAQDIERKYPTFAGIELNIGCPSPKVMACGGGSGMMKDKKRCLEIIKDISESIAMPFSIKVRCGLNEDDKQEQFDMLVQAAQYCHTISVHGRTFQQGHSNTVDRDFIHRLKQAVGDSCNIIGNGGITSYQDAIRHCEEGALANDAAIQEIKKIFPLDGIMTAQAAIGDPRVFVDHTPTLTERYDIIIEHLKLSIAYEIWFKKMIELYPHNPEDPILLTNKNALHYKKKIEDDDTLITTKTQTQIHEYILPFPHLQDIQTIAGTIEKNDTTPYRSIIEFRKYLFNYVKGIPGSKECKQQIATTKNYEELSRVITQFFERANAEESL